MSQTPTYRTTSEQLRKPHRPPAPVPPDAISVWELIQTDSVVDLGTVRFFWTWKLIELRQAPEENEAQPELPGTDVEPAAAPAAPEAPPAETAVEVAVAPKTQPGKKRGRKASKR